MPYQPHNTSKKEIKKEINEENEEIHSNQDEKNRDEKNKMKIKFEQPRCVIITLAIEETTCFKTLKFKDKKIAGAYPGQFVMVWIPGVDEIPMALSQIGEESAITVKKVGEATGKLFEVKGGEKIGIRGPYGRGFELTGFELTGDENLLFIAGGSGIIALRPAIEFALLSDCRVWLVHGALQKEGLLWRKFFESLPLSYLPCTDDGSYGKKGMACEGMREAISLEKFDRMITCGPEPMLREVAEMGKETGVEVQISMERYMKCGIGVCGSCSIGKGLRVCTEGPVFSGAQLLSTEDFGNFRRDSSGRRRKL